MRDVFDIRIVEYLIENMNLMIYRGILYIYKNGVYVKDKDGRKIKSQIQALMYDEMKTAIRINRVYNLLMCTNSIVVEEECTNNFPRHWINFKNGMLDVITGNMHDHSPDYRALNQIPHDYIIPDSEKELTFCKFMQDRMPDPDDRQTLYEFLGWCLTVDVSFEKMLYVVGEGSAGKSTLLEYVNNIVGRENISHISPQKMEQRFQSAFLMGKLLNSVSDISSAALRNTELIKQLTGEDAISAEIKGGDVFSFYNTAKMLFSANTMPSVKDEQTNGYYRRLLILRMNNGKYIPQLREKINAEIQDFIYFLVQQVKNAYNRGKLFESNSSIRAVSMLRFSSDSVQAFVEDVIEECPGFHVKRKSIYERYEDYCKAEKLDSLGRNEFYQSMESKGFATGKSNGEHVFKNVSVSSKYICLG